MPPEYVQRSKARVSFLQDFVGFDHSMQVFRTERRMAQDLSPEHTIRFQSHRRSPAHSSHRHSRFVRISANISAYRAGRPPKPDSPDMPQICTYGNSRLKSA